MWDENKSQRHPFLSWNRSHEVTRKFFHYCLLGGDSNRGRSPRSHRNDWPRSFLWGNELGLHQTSQGFCSRGHSRGYACLIKRRPRFGTRSLWRNWDPYQRGCRKPISRFIKEPIKLEMEHRPFHWWFYLFICWSWRLFLILLGQVSPTLKSFCLTVKFNFHVSFNPFCTDKVPFRHSPSIAQCKQKAFFVPRLWTCNRMLLRLPKTMIYWGFKKQWFIVGSGSGRW